MPASSLRSCRHTHPAKKEMIKCLGALPQLQVRKASFGHKQLGTRSAQRAGLETGTHDELLRHADRFL